MKIAVIGTGYVGLVTGTCFADSGNNVICIDNNPEKLDILRQGRIPIYEPGLETLFKRAIREKRMLFSDKLEDAVASSDILFLCLPTPPGADGQADLTSVLEVAARIGDLIGEYKVMGLAPYGEPKYRDLILDELIDLRDDGSFRMYMRYFGYGSGLRMTNRRFARLFG